MNTSHSKGYVIALVGTLLWSATAVFIRYLNLEYKIPVLILAFWRDLFTAGIVFLAMALLKPSLIQKGFSHVRFFLGYGALLAVFNFLWTFSVFLNGAAISTVLAYSSAAFTAIFGWLLWREELHLPKIMAVVFSIIGCILVSGAHQVQQWTSNPIGILTGLLSGIAFAGYTLLGRLASQKRIPTPTVLGYTFLTAALLLLMANAFFPLKWIDSRNLLWLGNRWDGWMVLFLLALIPTIGGYGLYTFSLNFLPASIANLIATLEPSFTALQSYLLLGERFTSDQILGSVLILLGVILLRLNEIRQSNQERRTAYETTSSQTPVIRD
ncbi:DMT family transporter [Anaerolinea thermophila]|uniref:Hypothetical membrane protein n=1 Tax=Anaerolinea thermophila (strain DSM 14523 / JCM 11388 / NBRC 100420 / UNI-1) TaxID=926569 RepID=E8N5L5_ANATU|nr:EamA family transporter [Anaerolinea thermophila]BAJ63729.1 hypothetical membrane protein [Anaerolinea thermophila UNI-1]